MSARILSLPGPIRQFVVDVGVGAVLSQRDSSDQKLSNCPKLSAAFIPWLVNACNDGIQGSDTDSGALCRLYIHFVPLNALKTCINGAMLTTVTAPLALTLA